MAQHFAAMDVGSNLIRWQISAVDHPKHYRVLEQGGEPIRLGREVFQTGKLNSKSVDGAIKLFGDFREVANRYRVKAIRAAGTSAMREAPLLGLLFNLFSAWSAYTFCAHSGAQHHGSRRFSPHRR